MFLPIFILLLIQGCVKIQGNDKSEKTGEDDGRKKGNCKVDEISDIIGPDILSRSGEFFNTLKTKANDDNLILLAVVDYAYLDMAVNLFETSIQKFNITNFLFICLDNSSYKNLFL